MAYSDPGALGAVSAARANGRKILTAGSNGGSDGIAGVRNGQLLVTTAVDAVRIGAMALAGLDDIKTGHGLPLPKSILVGAQLVTKDNVDGFESFDDKAARISRSGLNEQP
jgi:ABC-type sugar transport system substrate-binding protein